MTHIERLSLTLAIIFLSLTSGWLTRQAAEKGKISIGDPVLDALRQKLQTTAIFFFLPLSAMLSLWGLPQPRPQLLFLPLMGLASFVFGGILAIGAAIPLHLDKAQTGSYFCCGTFTNIGAIGGLVCLLFLGENSIALVALYRLFDEIFYFSVAFPVAQWYGSDNEKLNLRSFKLNPVLAAVIFALLLGITLNLCHIQRPDFLGYVASASMLLSTMCFLYAIGLTLHLSKIGGHLKAGIVLCAIKFLIIPAIVIALAMLCGLGHIENGLPLKAAAILSAMPVAMTALVPPALFHLDVDLANSCWIITTLGLVVTLPGLMLLLPMI